MFAGKVVLITGSSSGIGAGTAIHFAGLGAFVTITGRNVKKLNEVAKRCKEVGKIQPLVVAGDLSEDKFIKTLLDSTIKHFKKLDILVNNAGIALDGGLQNTSTEKYEELMKINVHAAFYLTQLAMPYLIKTKGNVVNVSSFAGIRVLPTALAYSMSKAALDQFTCCVALEMAGKGIRINGVNPGPVLTNIILAMGATEEQSANFFEQFKNSVPLKRVGTVEEIARAIAFLASEENASYITGVNLPVDAGQQVVNGAVSEKLDLNSKL